MSELFDLTNEQQEAIDDEMKSVVSYSPERGVQFTKTYDQKALASFTSEVLNAEPDPATILVNKFAGNARFIPIGVIESELDSIFPFWETTRFKWEVIANELVGSLELVLTHPITRTKMIRTGVGAVMIQTRANEAPTVENKIPNTLTKDAGHLKAECIKNAAKSLGKRFGRDLNRSTVKGYDFDVLDDVSTTDEIIQIQGIVEGCETIDQLMEAHESLDERQSRNKMILNEFSKRRREIEASQSVVIQ